MSRTQRGAWLLRGAVALTAGGLLAGALALAALHLRDLSSIHHLPGIWMSLARALNDGVFYPPLAADGHYAGTRYMPALFALMAGLARLTGDYLLSAKLLALLSVALLLAGVYLAGLRLTGRRADALALAGLVLAFPEGLMALLSPHADALAVALALGGLLLLDPGRSSDDSSPSPWRCGLAALLFVLSLAAKFSSLAAPAAAVAFLFACGGVRPARRLAAPCVLLGLAGLVALQLGSDGRFAENFRALGSGGMSGGSVRIGPARLIIALTRPSPFLLVWPAALAGVAWTARERRLGLWDWYLLAALGTTLLIFTSPGTNFNHLLELQVAAVLVVGRWLAAPAARAHLFAHALVLAALVLGLPGLAERARAEECGAIPPGELARTVPAGARLLTEDATVAVLLGQQPVVMDAFAYRVLAERGLIEDAELAGRVERKGFDILVFLHRIDVPEESLAPHFHFGPRVTAAMLRAYRFDRQVGRYPLFVPAVPGGRGRSPVAGRRQDLAARPRRAGRGRLPGPGPG